MKATPRDRRPMWRNSTTRYGAIAQLFHWAIVLLVGVQVVLAEIAEDLPLGLQKLGVLARHKSFGITILSLALLRLAWRRLSPPPTLPPQMRPYERALANLTHWGFYVFLICLPLSGWLMSSAANFPVSYFGLLTLPDLISPDKELVEPIKNLHELLGKLLFATIAIHVAAALKHHFFDRDDVLRRMLPGKAE